MKTFNCGLAKAMVVMVGVLLISPQGWSGESPAYNPKKKPPSGQKLPAPKKKVISTQPFFKTMSACDINGDGLIEDVTIPDPTLLKVIKETMGIDARSQIPVAKAEQLKTITVKGWPYDCYDNDKLDLSGLECFPGLIKLTVEQCGLSNLKPLAGLTNLTLLNLANNNINDLKPLNMLKNLKWLILYANNISDLTPLAGLKNLEWLDLNENNISDLTPLAGLKNLDNLELWKNNINDLTSLAGLTKLQNLYLSKNNINDLTPLAGLTNLSKLMLQENKISDIEPLLKNSGLGDDDYYTDMVYLSGNPNIPPSQIEQLKHQGPKGVHVFY